MPLVQGDSLKEHVMCQYMTDERANTNDQISFGKSSLAAFVTETKSAINEGGPWGYRGSYDLSSPAGHVGIGKVVYIDSTTLSPPPGQPTRFWAYETPLPEGGFMEIIPRAMTLIWDWWSGQSRRA